MPDWLRDRTRVALHWAASHWLSVTRGVPQGSVLRPGLFLVYIIYLKTRRLKSQNSPMIRNQKKKVQIKDYAIIQKNLDNLMQWSGSEQRDSNVDICKVMYFSDNNIKQEYRMFGLPLSEAKEERALGLIMSNGLRYTKQCLAGYDTAERNTFYG